MARLFSDTANIPHASLSVNDGGHRLEMQGVLLGGVVLSAVVVELRDEIVSAGVWARIIGLEEVSHTAYCLPAAPIRSAKIGLA